MGNVGGTLFAVRAQASTEAIRRYGIPQSQLAWDSVDYLLADWARERPDLDFTPVAVINRLGRVRTHLQHRLAEVFADHGLTAADFLVIVTLRRAGTPYRMPQARLMDALGLTSGTVSLRLDRLVKAGTVIRESDPDDRRGSLIRLTQQGQRLFDVLAPDHLANGDQLLSALSRDERRTLAGLLRHLLASLEAPRCPTADRLGLTLESPIVARRRRVAVGLSDTPGLLVTGAEPGSPAESAGMTRGDLIIEMDGQPALSIVAFAELIDQRPAGKGIALKVLRGNDPHDIKLVPLP